MGRLACAAGFVTGLVCGLLNRAISAFWGMPSFIITLGMLTIARDGALHVVDAQTVFGRLLNGIGNNEGAVRRAGHRVFWRKVAAFTNCGATAGSVAIINMSRVRIARPNAGIGFELNAIAAVILGGTSLAGGRGSGIAGIAGFALNKTTALQVFSHFCLDIVFTKASGTHGQTSLAIKEAAPAVLP